MILIMEKNVNREYINVYLISKVCYNRHMTHTANMYITDTQIPSRKKQWAMWFMFCCIKKRNCSL